MSNEYTPTIGEVREAVNEWVWSRRMWRPGLSPSDGMEFDRWLAEVERAAAEKAWDEAARVAVYVHAYRGGVEQWAGREIAKELRTRAEAYRREEA